MASVQPDHNATAAESTGWSPVAACSPEPQDTATAIVGRSRRVATANASVLAGLHHTLVIAAALAGRKVAAVGHRRGQVDPFCGSCT